MFSINGSTKMIRVADLSYPRYVRDMRLEFPNVSFPPANWSQPESITEWGYEYVWPVIPPVNDVVTEGQPELRADGLWYQTWSDRPFTEEEIADNLSNEKQSSRYAAQTIVDTQFESITEIEYKSILYGVRYKSDDFIMINAVNTLATNTSGTTDFTIRLQDVNFVGNREEAIEFTTKVISIFYNIQRRAWEFMALVDAATKLEDIPPLPDNFLS